jgi:hypothetical protein
VDRFEPKVDSKFDPTRRWLLIQDSGRVHRIRDFTASSNQEQRGQERKDRFQFARVGWAAAVYHIQTLARRPSGTEPMVRRRPPVLSSMRL